MTMIGESEDVQYARSLLLRAARTDLVVWIESAPSTEAIEAARWLHTLSGRLGRFVYVNCSGDTNLELRLVGCKGGTFESVNGQEGAFAGADRGTLCLDEIESMPTSLQSTLAAFLESRQWSPLGSDHSERSDVRVVCISREPLADLVPSRFRSELYHKLRPMRCQLPALVDRRSDLMDWIEHFLSEISAKLRRTEPTVQPEAYARLLEYDWPGNMAQLRSVLERAILLCKDGCIEVSDLPKEVAIEQLVRDTDGVQEVLTDSELTTLERRRIFGATVSVEMVKQALHQCGGNVTHAAKKLKMTRRGLQLYLSRNLTKFV